MAQTDQNKTSLSYYLNELHNVDIPELNHYEVIACGRLAKKGDLDARRYLIISHLRFVVDIAKRFADEKFPLEDAIQWGNYGLLCAVEGYDPDYKSNLDNPDDPEKAEKEKERRSPGLFTTYSKWYIEKAIREGKKECYGRKPTKKELQEGHTPDIYERLADYLSVDLNVSNKRGRKKVEPFAWFDELLLDSPAYSDDPNGETNESIIAANGIDPSEFFIDQDSKILLNKILDETISDVEKTIIEYAFGYHDEPMYEWDIAKMLGIDQLTVYKTINKVIVRLSKDKRIRELRGCIVD